MLVGQEADVLELTEVVEGNCDIRVLHGLREVEIICVFSSALINSLIEFIIIFLVLFFVFLFFVLLIFFLVLDWLLLLIV